MYTYIYMYTSIYIYGCTYVYIYGSAGAGDVLEHYFGSDQM